MGKMGKEQRETEWEEQQQFTEIHRGWKGLLDITAWQGLERDFSRLSPTPIPEQVHRYQAAEDNIQITFG